MFIFDAVLAAGLALQAVPATAAATPGAVPAQPPVASVAPLVPPAPEQVMAIPDELRAAFRARVVDATKMPEQRVRRMVDFMFDKDGLGLEYKGDATNTVAESYRTRQVNCLSFTLLAVALAREAGLRAQGQELDRVLAWNLVGNVVMQSLHANAVVTLKDRNLQVHDDRDFVLDIASSGLYTQDYIVHGYKVTDDRMLAAFYGNRAMELLAAGRLQESKAWLEKALQFDPEDATLWNNAGVLSLRLGEPVRAEEQFLHAARRDPRHTSVLFNLVGLYESRRDATRAGYWRERANRVLRRDPFYQFSLGERNAQAGNYEDAVLYYRRAISLDGRERLFHFALARAYVKTGRLDRAEKELDAAYRLSEGPERERFQAKLDALHAMAAR
ncbi:MAG: tetratricopeptide repeat protein [Luteimonas sp.]|jgi:tetratricopeptide (TPR) repeat protein